MASSLHVATCSLSHSNTKGLEWNRLLSHILNASRSFAIILEPGYNPISRKGEFIINQFHGHLLMNT